MNANMFKPRKTIDKGAPSGWMVSAGFHVAACFAAAALIVFRQYAEREVIITKPEPMPTRPAMILPKPRLRAQRSSEPKSSARIVANVRAQVTPDFKLPNVTGSGGNSLFDGGHGATFTEIPPPDGSYIGPPVPTVGNELEVTFYSMKRKANGTNNPRMDHVIFTRVIKDFVEGGWNPRSLDKYYRSPNKLYATTIAIPPVTSIVGPVSFGEDVEFGDCWAAHYRGSIIHKEGITFRFWGHADDILTVAIDKEVVLAANLPWTGIEAWTIANEWNDRAPGSRGQTDTNGLNICGNGVLAGSDWITLEPGMPYDFDAVIGEAPGGQFCAMLLVEVQGEHYEYNDWGGKTFPLFALSPIPRPLQNSILMGMYEGDAMVTNITTFFNDF